MHKCIRTCAKKSHGRIHSLPVHARRHAQKHRTLKPTTTLLASLCPHASEIRGQDVPQAAEEHELRLHRVGRRQAHDEKFRLLLRLVCVMSRHVHWQCVWPLIGCASGHCFCHSRNDLLSTSSSPTPSLVPARTSVRPRAMTLTCTHTAHLR